MKLLVHSDETKLTGLLILHLQLVFCFCWLLESPWIFSHNRMKLNKKPEAWTFFWIVNLFSYHHWIFLIYLYVHTKGYRNCSTAQGRSMMVIVNTCTHVNGESPFSASRSNVSKCGLKEQVATIKEPDWPLQQMSKNSSTARLRRPSLRPSSRMANNMSIDWMVVQV